MDLKDDLIEMLEKKNSYIEEFKTLTLTCITNVRDCKDEAEMAEKYIEFVELRQYCTNDITNIINIIKNDDKLSALFDSDDEDIVRLKNIYKENYENIKVLQPEMNRLGEGITDAVREEYKKVKQSQTFNNHYFNSPYTSGTVFEAKQ